MSTPIKKCKKTPRKFCRISAEERCKGSGIALLKKGIDNLLFLSHEFFAFFEAVGFTFDVDNGTVVKDAVEDSGGDGDVSKDLVPLGECFVRGEDGRGLFI